MIPKRKIALNVFGVVLGRREGGDRRREGHRRSATAAGIAQHDQRRLARPRTATMTQREDRRRRGSAGPRSRRGCRARCRAARSGVAYIAWKTLVPDRSPPMIGKVASNEAVCIAVARAAPGARNCEVRDAAERRGSSRRRTPPSPRPIAVRNRTGDRNELKIDAAARPPVEQQPVLEDAADASTAWAGRVAAQRSSRPPSLDQRAAGQPQEDVLERRPADEDGLGPRGRARGRRPRPPRRRRRRAGRGRAGARSARRCPSSWPSSVSATPAGKRSSVTSRVEYCSMSWRGRALGDDLRLVHDDEPVAQLLGLVHVVGRQDERHAPLLEPVEPVPEQVAGLRVEAGRRLVEEQDRRLVDERPGDRQAPLHPARQRLDLVVRRARSAGRTRAARRRAGATSAPRQAEVAAVDRRGSRGRSARCRACPAGARRRAGRGSAARRVPGPCRGRSSVPSLTGETQPIIRIVEVLPAPFGPRKPNDLAGRDVEVDGVDGGELAEPLGQAAGMDERRGSGLFRHGNRDRTPGPWAGHVMFMGKSARR